MDEIIKAEELYDRNDSGDSEYLSPFEELAHRWDNMSMDGEGAKDNSDDVEGKESESQSSSASASASASGKEKKSDKMKKVLSNYFKTHGIEIKSKSKSMLKSVKRSTFDPMKKRTYDPVKKHTFDHVNNLINNNIIRRGSSEKKEGGD